MAKKKQAPVIRELIGDRNISFQEREKRAVEIKQRIAESYPMVGGAADDNLWRSLNQLSNRDLYTLTQKRMQDIAFYLYDSNPMAKRIIEICRDFVVGDGFTYSAEDPDVLEVIEEFWNDPDNNLDVENDVNVLELGIFGELCLPTWVNSANGAVKLGYIDPALILRVKKDKLNPKLNRSLIWKPIGQDKEPIELDIVNIDKDIKSKSYGYRQGECFFFTINKVSSAMRGRSDLLTLCDFIDGHDQFLFARLERAFLLNTFIWDVTCEGMNKEDLTEFVKGLAMPKAGSIRAHNEKVQWKSETPKLESADASEEARLFKMQILGGAGYPEHWFGCHSEDTEILTENGWEYFWELKKETKVMTYNKETNYIEFQKPNKIYDYDYDGDLYEFNSKNVNLCITPNHNLLTYHKYTKIPRFEEKIIEAQNLNLAPNKRIFFKASNIFWKGKNINSIVINKTKYPMDIFVEFIGYFISEGWLTYNNGYQIGLCQTNPVVLNKMKQCLKRLNLHFNEYLKEHNNTALRIYKKDLWMWLKDNCGKGSYNKKIPKEFLSLDKKYLEILFQALMDGYGSIDKRTKERTCCMYYTVSEQLADDFQELCLRLGLSCQIGVRQRNTFSLHISNRKKFCIKNNHIKKVKYTGKVYSVNVDNGFYVSRRNGKIGIHHNSGDRTNRATALTMGEPTLKKLKSRQRAVKSQLVNILNYVIDQAILANRLPRDVDRTFKVIPSPIVSRDNKDMANSIGNLVDGLEKATIKKWLSDKQAKRIFNSVISQLGSPIESTDQELDESADDEDPVILPKEKKEKEPTNE